ncbi:MAG: acetyl-CoA carboxylase, carboxyltransferase subunit beta [Kiritimatiellia bacterium]
MGWFNRSASKKKQSEIPEGLFAVCPRCKAHIYKDEYETASRVCPKCNHHERLTASERIKLIVDEGTFREFNREIKPNDPLDFKDAKSTYKQKAQEAIAKTGLNEAVVTGSGDINGIRCVLAVMDFRFLGGSLASATGEKILLAAEHALRMKRALLIFSASGGARMHEGIVSLMQMAKTCAGISRLDRAKLPYISIMTDPTYGGVSASYATVGDINIAEPGALIGFAGRRVIEQTIKEKLPDDFQTAEYLLAHGFLDAIVNREEMKEYLHRILLYSLGKKA